MAATCETRLCSDSSSGVSPLIATRLAQRVVRIAVERQVALERRDVAHRASEHAHPREVPRRIEDADLDRAESLATR